MGSSPSRPKVLTAAFVRTINRPGRYGDGRGSHGLSLLVKPTANGRWSRTWAQRLRIGGMAVSLGLGSYPAVSLALARERALANRQTVEEGRDPRRKNAVTFADAMHEVIVLHRPNWKPTSNTERQWWALLGAPHHPDHRSQCQWETSQPPTLWRCSTGCGTGPSWPAEQPVGSPRR